MQKEKIMRESLSLFRRYGIKSTSMDDISGHLKVSKKTIYRYFKDKEEVLLYAIDRAIEDFEEGFREILQRNKNPLLAVAEIYRYVLTEISHYSNPYFYDIKKIPAANKRIETFQEKMANVYFLPLLREAQAQGYVRKDVDLQLVHEIHFYRLNELMSGINFRKRNESIHELYRHLVVVNLRGLLSTEHQGMLDALLEEEDVE